ncbi:MAG: hypothetical protein JJ920_04160 [Roseitalea sp.]|nr:hypothetical protein [Roseitalea sp.]MBO6721523.1 hypothetical protein [Roseitalea sp.]MBO6742080.1 hypothetical protein [Roseitalea sp.]
MCFHFSEINRIASILADDPQLSNDEILHAITVADRTVVRHRHADMAVPFEVHRVRRILALAIAKRLNTKVDLQ